MDVIGLPLRIGGFEPVIEPAPLLGADTAAVLKELLGYDDVRINELVGSGAVATKGA
jgi:crotonobetainyl-CoA:carnitine CoA-transferase CaiB-like acyl-CoA transferase